MVNHHHDINAVDDFSWLSLCHLAAAHPGRTNGGAPVSRGGRPCGCSGGCPARSCSCSGAASSADPSELVAVTGEDPVLARMRQQLQLFQMVRSLCPEMSHQEKQSTAAACLGSAPASALPEVSMTPVGATPPPWFPLSMPVA